MPLVPRPPAVCPPHLSLPSPLTILSPHRDDAAFSCGALLALVAEVRLSVTLLNVFTRSAYAPFAPPGLSTTEVTALRLSEDLTVTTRLGPAARLVDLDLLDAPLRLGIRDDQVIFRPLTQGARAAELQHLRAALPDLGASEVILIPLALGSHIDHLLARDAALAAFPSDRLGFYQDLPYASRARHAEDLARETAAVLHAATLATRTPFTPTLLRTSPSAIPKPRLLDCYPSQVAIETMDEMARWTASLGGEQLYLSPAALLRLRTLLPAASLNSNPPALTTQT